MLLIVGWCGRLRVYPSCRFSLELFLGVITSLSDEGSLVCCVNFCYGDMSLFSLGYCGRLVLVPENFWIVFGQGGCTYSLLCCGSVVKGCCCSVRVELSEGCVAPQCVWLRGITVGWWFRYRSILV